jgi:RNA polymerase sigma factor (sigma-70 family)
MEDWQLLQNYVGQNSEAAFRELVNRYINLVHSAAQRQVQNELLAEEVTQAVFILLARKARGLRRDVIFSGWLFRTTRFVAARAIRAEQRRQRREQEAYQMQQLTHPDENWKRIAPVLDEALGNLGAADRNAVLLRFFNDKSFRETGSALGVSEDAAKKRVTRALEKLRLFFSKRGVTFSAAILASALSSHAVTAAPVPLAMAVSTRAIASGSVAAAALPTLVCEVLNAWRWTKLTIASASLAVGIVAAELTMTFVLPKQIDPREDSNLRASAISNFTPTNADESVGIPSALTDVANSKREKVLIFRAIAADTGEPVGRAILSVNTVANGKWTQRYDLTTDTSGKCRVPYPKDTSRLDVGVLSTGWGARFATWVMDRNPIPPEYTLKVERLTNSIGGQLRDEAGQPVANAEILVSFHGTGDASARETPRERIGAMEEAPVAKTDFQGRWICAVIPAKHDGFEIHASHPDFRKTLVVNSAPQESLSEIKDEKLKQLWNGTLMTVMDRGLTFVGRVVDESGNGIAGAQITEGIQQKIFKTDFDGEFVIPKREKGEWKFTVCAEGFAPVRRKVEMSQKMEPTIVQMKPGAVLRLKVVDGIGFAVPKATVGLEQWGEDRYTLGWNALSDSEGRIEWRSAPPGVKLELYSRKDGYCYTRNVWVEADGKEHSITLRKQLTVSGRATDSETGLPILEFKSFPGYGTEKYDWERHATRHSTNGVFKVTFTENKFPWRIRVEADGYEPAISEPLREDFVGELEMKLKRPNPDDQIRGTVLLSDGNPAVGADVALLTFEQGANLEQGRFKRRGSDNILTRTDAEGKFEFKPDVNAHTIAAAHSSGFGRARIHDGQSIIVQLSPWGKIDGRVRTRDGKWSDRQVMLTSPYSDAGFNVSFSVKSDAEGRFLMEPVPAGNYTLYLNPGGGKPFTDATFVEVREDETTQSQIGGVGATVTGRLKFDGSAVVVWEKQTKFSTMQPKSTPPPFRRVSPSDPRSLDPAERRKRLDLVESDEWFAWARVQRPSVALKIAADGSFVAENLRAGEYSLNVELMAEPAESSNFMALFQRPTMASMRRTVMISEAQEHAGEILDFGVVELQPSAQKAR